MTGEAEPGKAKAAGIVGILIGAVGLCNLVCGFIYAALGGKDGSGLWVGFPHIIIFILGLVTWLKLSKGALIGYLVLSILMQIVTIVFVIICLIAWLIWHIIRKVVESECAQEGDQCVCHAEKKVPIPVDKCSHINTIESCFACMTFVNIIGAILLLAASIIGCMGTCCAKSETNVVVVQQPAVVMTTQQQGQAPPEYPEKPGY